MSDDENKHHPMVRLHTREGVGGCVLCCIEGGLEEGLLAGFHAGVMTATRAPNEPKLPVCVDHRIRLSFYFELADKLAQAVPPMIPTPQGRPD